MKPREEIPFEPVSRALQVMLTWLVNNGWSRLMVAAPGMEEMRRQPLPPHVVISPQLQRGPRVPLRSAPFAEGARVFLANWPEAGMGEYSLPILACVLNGQADLRAGDYVLHCRAGDFVYFPAGIPKCNGQKPHLVGDVEGRSCDVLWINKAIPAMGLCCYICQSRGTQHQTHLPDRECFSFNILLQQVFDGFCEELQQRGADKMAVEMLSLLLSLFKRDIDERIVRPFPYTQSRPDVGQGGSYDPIEQACLYIDTHLELHLTIENVARQVYLSPTQFTRRFRRHTGQSFHEYLTAKRLEKAVEFLRDTNMMVQHISQFVGIKPNQLRNLFQEKYGCSPAEFRHRHSAPGSVE